MLLKKLRGRYSELKEKMETVAQGLDARSVLEDIDDPNSYGDVTAPVLLVKEYQEKDCWLTVPGNSYVTDREFLTQLCTVNARHPLNRDSLVNRPPHMNKPARYQVYALNAEYCWVPELNNIAKQMRTLLDSKMSYRPFESMAVTFSGLNFFNKVTVNKDSMSSTPELLNRNNLLRMNL